MTTAYRTFGSPYALGLTSLVLSAVGLLLFFLPILGIPLASVGLLFGLAGLLAALFGDDPVSAGRCWGSCSLSWPSGPI